MLQTLNPVPYRFCTLYSGSEGNAAYLETPSARILIDAGRCARTLTASLRQLGVSPEELDAVFITHEHRDHIAALEVLTRKHPLPVHMLLDCAMRYRDSQAEALCSCLVLYRQPDFTATVGDVTVRAFPTLHDSRASVGYRFEFGGISVGYMTDTGCVTDRMEQMLSGCEAVVLESNHDEQLLLSGPYPYELKLRIRSNRGHLSNRDAAALAARLADRFSVIGILNRADRCIRENVRRYGVEPLLASVPVVDMPVAVLHDNEEMLKEKTIEAAVKAVREDGAHAVIFGCTCMCTVQEAVAEGLKKQGIDIPVIEPYRAALYDAIACVLQGVSHSKYAYWPVEEKLRRLDWKP